MLMAKVLRSHCDNSAYLGQCRPLCCSYHQDNERENLFIKGIGGIDLAKVSSLLLDSKCLTEYQCFKRNFIGIFQFFKKTKCAFVFSQMESAQSCKSVGSLIARIELQYPASVRSCTRIVSYPVKVFSIGQMVCQRCL